MLRANSTTGQVPPHLVGAATVYINNEEIYAFGGSNLDTNEVFNTFYRLSLKNLQWTLVDNYGHIPGVRTDHTGTLWQGDKVIIFGGEDEHQRPLNDLYIFDIKTATWIQPETQGSIPQSRAHKKIASATFFM